MNKRVNLLIFRNIAFVLMLFSVALPVSVRAVPSLVEVGSQTVNQGQPVSFTVTAVGSGTISYQWQKDGVDIINAKSSSYTLASAQPQNIGYYTCNVTDSKGAVTSKQAALTVNGVPFGMWQGLVAYYPFNGNANNEVKTGADGNPLQAVLTNDRFGTDSKAYSFDGSASVIGTIDRL